MSPRKSARVALIALFGILLASTCNAQEMKSSYPTKPVNIILPFPAGSGGDVLTRVITRALQGAGGQPFLVINRPGANGSIAAESVKRADPDGYTVLSGSSSTMSAYWALKTNPPFDTLRDFIPVTPIGVSYYMLLVHPSVPAKTLPEFITYLKQNPGKLNYGSAGYGGVPHLLAEMFMQATGTKMTHVPYQGTVQSTNAAVSGADVQVTFDQLLSKAGMVDTGKLRALGIASLKRSPLAPDIPPIADTLPGFEGSSWGGLFVPAGTPAPIVDQLRKIWEQAAASTDVQSTLASLGNVPLSLSTEEFTALIKSEADKWREVGKKAGVVLE